MKPELREKIISYNKAVAANKEKADDLMTLLSALPPGQVKKLLKDETCGAILSKYGITGEEKSSDWERVLKENSSSLF